MKRQGQKQKLMGWGALVLAHLILGGGFSQTAFARCKDGGGCSGGTNTVDGVPISRYLREREIKSDTLIALIGPQLERIRKVHPELAEALVHDLKSMSWHFSDKPIKELPFANTSVPIASEQAGTQFDDIVVFHRALFSGLKDDDARRETIFSELLERHFLKQGGGVNANLRPAHYWKAAGMLMRKDLPAKDTLQTELEALGFSLVGKRLFARADAGDRIKELDKRDFSVDYEIPIGRDVYMADIEKAQEACMVGSGNGSVFERLGQHVFKAPRAVVGPGEMKPTAPLSTVANIRENAFESSGGDVSLFDGNRMIGLITGRTPWPSRETADLLDVHRLSVEVLRLPARSPRDSIHFHSTSWFPRIRYEFAAQSQIFDEDGALNRSAKFRSIKLEVPESVVADNMKMGLANQDTRIQLAYKLDIQEYLGCLRREFANATNLRPAAAPVTPGAGLKGK